MLADMDMQPVGSGEKPLSEFEQAKWLEQLDGWEIKENAEAGYLYLSKVFRFANFEEALGFVNRVGELAEAENHHPEMRLSWGRVEARWWTHTVHGLHLNDFIMAARTDFLAK